MPLSRKRTWVVLVDAEASVVLVEVEVKSRG